MDRVSGHCNHRFNHHDVSHRNSSDLTRCRSSMDAFPRSFNKSPESEFNGGCTTRRRSRPSSCVTHREAGSSCSSGEMMDDDESIPNLKPTNYPNHVLTNSFLPAKDMAKMWDLIARFVERRIEKGKGVNLPRLGTLTLHSQKMRLSQELFQHSLKPIFIVSGKFAIFHRLPQSTYRTSSDVPNVVLSFITLSRILAIDKDRLEMAYNETLEKISAILRSGKKATLPFRGIGQLVFCLESVKMNFTPEFLARNQTTKIIKLTEKTSKYACFR